MDSHDYTGAFVGDDSDNSACKPVLSADGSSYELEHGLEECGTTLELTEDGSLKYSVSLENINKSFHTTKRINLLIKS